MQGLLYPLILKLSHSDTKTYLMTATRICKVLSTNHHQNDKSYHSVEPKLFILIVTLFSPLCMAAFAAARKHTYLYIIAEAP
jgi:hypothetical protein